MINERHSNGGKSRDIVESKIRTGDGVESKAKAKSDIENKDEEKEGGSSLHSNWAG